MAYLANRRKIAAAVGVALAVVLIALVASAWPRSEADAHAGGDPGGQLMAKIAPVVRVVPGFEHGRVPWIAFPCDSCQFPVRYAIKIEPRWDSCDGAAGTFGWDPAVVQVGFRWAGSSQALVSLLDERLGARGWARGAVPSWGSGADEAWVRPHGHAPAEDFALQAPISAANHQWMAFVEAKPVGQLVKGC